MNEDEYWLLTVSRSGETRTFIYNEIYKGSISDWLIKKLEIKNFKFCLINSIKINYEEFEKIKDIYPPISNEKSVNIKNNTLFWWSV